MSTRYTLAALALFVVLTPPATSGAQQSPSGCTYATCALRVEQTFFGGQRLLRGAKGEQVSKLGAFGGGVDLLLHSPDPVSSHARSYVTATRRSTVLGLVGVAAYVAVLLRTDNFRDDFDDASVATSIVGTAFGIAAVPFAMKAKRELARAVWWYNGELATSVSATPAVDSIVLERTPCFGFCPAYRLRISGTGAVAFVSRNPEDAGRSGSGAAPADSVAALARAAEEIGFQSLPDTISRGTELCPRASTDSPSAILSIFRRTGAKSVVDYHGCSGGDDKSAGDLLRRLRALETRVDSVAGAARWVRRRTVR